VRGIKSLQFSILIVIAKSYVERYAGHFITQLFEPLFDLIYQTTLDQLPNSLIALYASFRISSHCDHTYDLVLPHSSSYILILRNRI